MSSAPVLFDEQTRLDALRRYRILDTTSEEAFDDLVHTAAVVCRTPISLISLVDATRQWFKARVGLDVQELPRESAFCAHAIVGSELLVVPDTHADPRFANNPLVLGVPNIRFYAGAPLVTPEGLGLGTLCVIDRVPRSIGAEEARALRGMARQAMVQLELRRALLELDEHAADLDAFASTVAHDLRAPLRATSGFAQVVREEYAGKVLDEEGARLLDRVVEGSARMDALIEGLLSYARMSRQEVVLEPVELGSLLDEVLRNLAPDLESRQAAVDVPPCLPIVRAHRLTLGQALTNLLSNAVKFVAPGILPRVTISAQRRDRRVFLSIADNGIGIASELKDRLFKPFSRLHGPGGPYPGVGIGLAIVRKAVDQMGGSAGVDSMPGKGSRFWLELPLDASDPGRGAN